MNRWSTYPVDYFEYFPKLPWVAAREALYAAHHNILLSVTQLILKINPLEELMKKTDVTTKMVEKMLAIFLMNVSDFKLRLDFELPGMYGQKPTDLINVKPVKQLP